MTGAVRRRRNTFGPCAILILKCRKGRCLGIIGKNGAGKSTLLKILSRVTSPTTGVIKTKGRIASLLEVGTGFHPELTGRENIYLNGAILGMTRAEITAKLDEIIEFSGCEMYIDTPTKRYSSGMTVRLAFAVAAHLEPDILVVDEVLAVGDAEFQKKAIGKMQDISTSEGRTVLFVSHNMAAVKSLCTRAIVLENGNSVFEGETNQAVDFYLHNEKLVIKTDLHLLKNRRGNGLIVFKKFHLENDKGQVIDQILTGDTIVFCFTLMVNTVILDEMLIDVGFSLHTNEDELISVLYSSYQDSEVKVDKEDSYIVKCRITHLSLGEGEYIVRGRILANKVEADWLKDPLGKFNVFKGNFYGTGNSGFEGRSKLLLKGAWELIK